MTIADARALQAADLDIGDDAIAAAEAEAKEAAELVDALERAAVESAKKPTNAAATAEAKQLADFAAKRLQRTRQRADQATAARRLLDLEAVGKDVEAIAAAAAAPGQSITAAIQQIAQGHADLMRLISDHDQKVEAVISRAKELAAEPPAPKGPRASSAHVTVLGDGMMGAPGIQSGNAVVRKIGPKTAAEAAQIAAAGDADAAIRRLQAARHVAPPKRADHYFHATTSGRIITSDHPVPDALRDQIRKRQLRELTPAEIDVYLDGRLDGQ